MASMFVWVSGGGGGGGVRGGSHEWLFYLVVSVRLLTFVLLLHVEALHERVRGGAEENQEVGEPPEARLCLLGEEETHVVGRKYFYKYVNKFFPVCWQPYAFTATRSRRRCCC